MDGLELKDATHFLGDFGDIHMCGAKKVRGPGPMLK